MRLFNILLVSILIFPGILFSKEVDVKKAQNAAKTFFYNNSETGKTRSYNSVNLVLNHTEVDEQKMFYVFNIEGQNGFVITSAQDFTRPILGYSDKNNIDFDNLSPELAFMLEYYKKQIKAGLKENAKPSAKVQNMWKHLKTPSTNRTSVTDKAGPLLLTEWNQMPYYNDMCPTDANGEHAVVGCVAVAMAQIMKYYDYPKKGEGFKYYADNEGSLQHSAQINYGEEEYKWGNMPATLDHPNEDVAKLMYHCGHTTRMDWEVDGSGTQTGNVKEALENYFGYASTSTLVNRKSYDDAQWGAIIRSDINSGRPIIYAGKSSGSSVGHAWNCDGYISDGNDGYLYHMNYGWGGAGNGYFALDQLKSNPYPYGDPEYFDTNIRMLRKIKPKADAYPSHCSEERIITGKEGLFGDGSGNENYQNNINCRTIIQPECYNGIVKLRFERFDLAEDDVIKIYNGVSKNDRLIAIINAENPPGDKIYTSTNGGMLIRFITNSKNTATGWDASYISESCDEIHVKEGSGIISDGSGSCDYETNTNCLWYLEPMNASEFILNFSEFNLDSPEHDYVDIYKNSEQSQNRVMRLKGTEMPPENIKINADRVILKFKSYSEFSEPNVGAGWTLHFTTDVDAIETIPTKGLVKVYPNPFNKDAVIDIENPSREPIYLSLTNLVGQVMATKHFENIDEDMSIHLSDMTDTKFEKGIYFLNIRVGNKVQSYKLISE